jgi:hypothetical protein
METKVEDRLMTEAEKRAAIDALTDMLLDEVMCPKCRHEVRMALCEIEKLEQEGKIREKF